MTPLENEIHEIVEQTMRLTQSFVIWREIMKRQSALDFDDVRREYVDFFEPVAHSLEQGFFVILYQLFDHRQDSKHIHSLISEVKKHDISAGGELESRIATFGHLEKIETVRHKVYAHRDKKLSPDLIYSEAAITISEMQTIVRFVHELVSRTVQAAGGQKAVVLMQQIIACESSSRDAAFQVLKALNRDWIQQTGDAPDIGKCGRHPFPSNTLTARPEPYTRRPGIA